MLYAMVFDFVPLLGVYNDNLKFKILAICASKADSIHSHHV